MMIARSILAIALVTAAAPAFAQQPTAAQTDTNAIRNTPDPGLTPAQKQTIYASISNMSAKETAPSTFRAAVGEVIPQSVTTQPMPKTIVDLMPQTSAYEYAMVSGQVLLVEPQSKKIVDVIAQQ